MRHAPTVHQDCVDTPVASLLLIAMPFVTSSFLLLVVRPGATSSVLAPRSQTCWVDLLLDLFSATEPLEGTYYLIS